MRFALDGGFGDYHIIELDGTQVYGAENLYIGMPKGYERCVAERAAIEAARRGEAHSGRYRITQVTPSARGGF